MQKDDEVNRARHFFFEYHEMFVVTGLEGTALDVNKAATRALGPEFGPGTALTSLVHPDERAAFEAEWAHLADGKPVDTTCRLRAAGGEHVAFEINAHRADGQPWVYTKLSPAKREPIEADPLGEKTTAKTNDIAYQALLLRTMLEHINMVAWAIDTDGRYTIQEGKALAVMGLRPGQLIGQNCFELYDAASTEGMRRALEGEVSHNVIQLGDVFWENWLGPVRDEGGEIKGAFGISLNATDAQRAKVELEAKLQLIERQQEVIRNLETPVIQVWDRVLTLPMVGVVDSSRAARVMDDVLGAVTRTQARFAILDLTGVEVVDTATANHLISIIRGVRLLGAEGILSGIRPNVAQTVISLGLDLSGIVSVAHLRDALSLAIRRMAAEKR